MNWITAMTGKHKRKLIETSLPLPEINDASAYDKMPGIGAHPKGIHQWWARLPLPTARAILFASVVDDPEGHPDKWPTDADQAAERERLFDIMRRLMGKKLHESPEVYAEAETEMRTHCGGKLPIVFDPFSGGGSIPLEAHRMGFEAHAGDLNPVAVLLNKCNLEIAPKWVDRPPINPVDRNKIEGGRGWRGTEGLAADIRFYGAKVRERAIEKIGRYFPRAQVTEELGGAEADVISWIWARTVASPDPAFRGKHVPLISTYWLSTKENSLAWLEPEIDRNAGKYSFSVRFDTPDDKDAVSSGTKASRSGFKCILGGASIPYEYIRTQGQNDAIGTKLIAMVVDKGRGKTYLPANELHEKIAYTPRPTNFPETDLHTNKALGIRIQNYGIRQHWQMFSPRQLEAMVTLSDLIKELKQEICEDYVSRDGGGGGGRMLC